MSDDENINLAQKIKGLVKYSIITLSPNNYNNAYSKYNNLNVLLASMHGAVINSLFVEEVSSIPIIIDQFTDNKRLLLYMEKFLEEKSLLNQIKTKTKAESDYIAVAAASIIARASFLENMTYLAKEYNVSMIKGATNNAIQSVCEEISRSSPEILSCVAKLHFKPIAKLIKSPMPSKAAAIKQPKLHPIKQPKVPKNPN